MKRKISKVLCLGLITATMVTTLTLGEPTEIKAAKMTTVTFGTDDMSTWRDADGYDMSGYDSDGYNHDGYNADGYDDEGYDRDGYDKNGYDLEGFDRNGFDQDGNSKYQQVVDITFKNQIEGTNKIPWSPTKNLIEVERAYLYTNRFIEEPDYKVSIKKVSVDKNGYGTYKVTVKCTEEYYNSEYSKKVVVIPDEEVNTNLWHDYYSSKSSKRYLTLTVFPQRTKAKWKNAYKNITGVECQVATDKKFKHIYKKVSSTKKPSATSNISLPDINYDYKKTPDLYCRWRTYVTVKGKKIYSEWKIYD